MVTFLALSVCEACTSCLPDTLSCFQLLFSLLQYSIRGLSPPTGTLLLEPNASLILKWIGTIPDTYGGLHSTGICTFQLEASSHETHENGERHSITNNELLVYIFAEKAVFITFL